MIDRERSGGLVPGPEPALVQDPQVGGEQGAAAATTAEQDVRPPGRGFTLLEVMVALAILALSLTALLGTQSSSVVLTHYINGVTVASLLAKSKMLDLEAKLKKDGFDAFGEDRETGDFGEEGHRDFTWEAVIEKIEIDESAVQNLLESAPQSKDEVVGKLMENPQLAGMDLSSINFNPQMIFGFVPTAIEMLGEKVRKCTLTISWKDGKRKRSVEFQSYFVQYEEFTKTEEGGEPGQAGPAGDGTEQKTSETIEQVVK